MDMLAAKDQENFVHGLQTAAASKPLNAGLKGLAAKTPATRAPKTPFKLPLNDENAVARGGKSLLQTKGTAKEQHGKLDSNAFVTPAGPRTRAPLGMKTTNAKARAFQTPALLSGSAKTQKASPRLRRPKVKVQPDVQHADEHGVPEVEYMPPKEVPLPDDMDDYLPRDWKIPKLENGGVDDVYHNPLEDDGRTKLQRQFEETLERDIRKRDEKFDRILDQQIEKNHVDAARHFGVALPKQIVPKPTLTAGEHLRQGPTGPSTLKARSAAASLSSSRRPVYAAPTTAIKSRLPSKQVADKKSIINSSTARHAAAVAASKSTIGYAQGRENAMSRLQPRKPLSNVMRTAPFSVTTKRTTTLPSTHNRNTSTSSATGKSRRAFSRSSSTSTNATLVAPPRDASTYCTAEEIERELELMLLRDDDNDDEESWAHSFSNLLGGGDPFDEDVNDFQFQLPEDM
ncbi:uncharacterized protein CC84DRAFT_1132158 [Paraphaeosphaeria sporulosa]|uniref:Uncharacterized protein n=1 Tax=Paraphaeosphaeria sporulosa TaxID=1460663 RepID=A0A177BTJ7_9PLEO|nr:uncharacterized protein CC84DRAFT_1132158 [Paraphaeosphaeria sporulosa]OAF98723.1 hypothetical protein CC84DRAFT_1132158 [Paraphaeosphaeria sporulosa]